MKIPDDVFETRCRYCRHRQTEENREIPVATPQGLLRFFVIFSSAKARKKARTVAPRWAISSAKKQKNANKTAAPKRRGLICFCLQCPIRSRPAVRTHPSGDAGVCSKSPRVRTTILLRASFPTPKRVRCCRRSARTTFRSRRTRSRSRSACIPSAEPTRATRSRGAELRFLQPSEDQTGFEKS